jgi:hypothetical protein
MIISPAHGDNMIPMAACLAVAEIKREGGKVGAAFRQHADAWMMSFGKLPREIQATVRATMEVAWWDGGSQLPPHLFDRSGHFVAKTFDEIYADLQSKLPHMLSRPPS